MASARNAALGSSVGVDSGSNAVSSGCSVAIARLVTAQRHLQECQGAQQPLRQPKCPCAPADLECLLGRRPGVGFAAGERGQWRPQAEGQEQRSVAAELASPFQRVLGDQAGLDEVAPPDAAQHHVLGDEHELAFLTLLHAATPDRFQRLMGLVEAAGPLQQQGALHGWAKHQRREGLLVLQFHSTMQSRLVETFARHEPQDDAHAQRQAQQVWLVEALGLADRSFCGRLALSSLVVVHERVGQRDQYLHSQWTVVTRSLSACCSTRAASKNRLCTAARRRAGTTPLRAGRRAPAARRSPRARRAPARGRRRRNGVGPNGVDDRGCHRRGRSPGPSVRRPPRVRPRTARTPPLCRAPAA